MKTAFFSRLLRKSKSTACKTRLQLEGLEQRQVMSVTYHGGALLSHVEVQGVYYGSDWSNNPALNSQTGYLNGFLAHVVDSPYMDLLANAGYWVGRGSSTQGVISLADIDKTQYLADSTLQDVLQSYISDGSLQQPDANRLYVIFVEPDVAVQRGDGTNSQVDFRGYHGAFPGTDQAGNPVTVHYAVVAYPGGTAGNASIPWLSSLDTITKTASHEIAEAAVDPDVGYQTLGWYDDQANGEIGDIGGMPNEVAYVDGYAVQRLADPNDQAMTPANATAQEPVTFVLSQNYLTWAGGYPHYTNALYEQSQPGTPMLYLTSGVRSISDQGIDDHGQAMIDVVYNNGTAYEYHDGSGWTYLTSNVVQAKAGQGESFLLLSNGSLWEYKDQAGSLRLLDTSVTAIDAGTDRHGVNAVAEIWGGTAWVYSDSAGWNRIANNVVQLSAGRQGIVDLVFSDGTAYWWLPYGDGVAGGQLVYLSSGVTEVTAGFDPNGNYIIDELFTNGDAYEYRVDRGWTFLDSNVRSLSKSRAGIVDYVTYADVAWDVDNSGSYGLFLTGVAQVA
jgi:hypothetical protein